MYWKSSSEYLAILDVIEDIAELGGKDLWVEGPSNSSISRSIEKKAQDVGATESTIKSTKENVTKGTTKAWSFWKHLQSWNEVILEKQSNLIQTD